MGTFIVILLVIVVILIFTIKTQKKDNRHIAKTDSEFEDINDIIIGYEFQANLWTPHTSLDALNHHGERKYSIREDELPRFEDSYRSHGIWLPIGDNDRDNITPTDKEIKELEFLKKFRKTYESDLPHEQKIDIISKLHREYPDLPSNLLAKDWYLWELMEISGISDEISKVLYFNGIKTKQEVKLASDENLLNIPGIGKKRLMQIRAYFLQCELEQ